MPEVPMSEPAGRRAVFRNIGLLTVCEALGIGASALVITVTALIGQSLAPAKSLATLPLALQFVTIMAATVPASYLMKFHGRRTGFMGGACLGIVSGLVGAYAIHRQSFALFCLASAVFGGATVFVQYYRFAAVELAGETYKSRAVSLALSGGVAAAFLGPELARVTRHMIAPQPFTATYLALSCLFAALLLVIAAIRFPGPTAEERGGSGRPLTEVVRRPTFVVAVLCAAVAYGSMNFVMSATPLAMTGQGHGFDAAATVIQWHIVGMYAPSFVTGHLIHRFGIPPILTIGALAMAAGVGVNLSGSGVSEFWIGLVLLGIGWNFMFIGGTTLLTESYSAAEKAKVQGLNDLLMFATISCTAFMSGTAFHFFGWQALNLAILAPIALCLGAIVWLRHSRAGTASPQPTN